MASGERSPDLGLSLAIVSMVLVTTMWRGPLFGVSRGIALAMPLFIRQLSRLASAFALKRGAAAVAARSSGCGRGTARALESSDRSARTGGRAFLRHAEQVNLATDALPAGRAVLVLELRHVSTVDDTGAPHVLAPLAPRLQRRSARLLLAGVQPGRPLGQRLHLFGFGGQDGRDWFANADLAIEAAERLLRSAGPSPSISTPPAKMCSATATRPTWSTGWCAVRSASSHRAKTGRPGRAMRACRPKGPRHAGISKKKATALRWP